MAKNHLTYIPALSQNWLTPLFDPFLSLTMRDDVFKWRLVQQAHIAAGQRVLDLGCGTATLTVLIKQLQPAAEVIGLDADPQVLDIARRRATTTGQVITFDEGMSYALPYADGSFDRVLSSLVFHHLTRTVKAQTARELFRVLRPGGELHVADFGQPHTALARGIGFLMRRAERVADNIEGFLPRAFAQAGFVHIEEPIRYMTVFGTLSLYQAQKPA